MGYTPAPPGTIIWLRPSMAYRCPFLYVSYKSWFSCHGSYSYSPDGPAPVRHYLLQAPPLARSFIFIGLQLCLLSASCPPTTLRPRPYVLWVRTTPPLARPSFIRPRPSCARPLSMSARGRLCTYRYLLINLNSAPGPRTWLAGPHRRHPEGKVFPLILQSLPFLQMVKKQ